MVVLAGETDAIRICLKTRFGLISSLTPREKSNFRLVIEPDIQFIGDLFSPFPSSESPLFSLFFFPSLFSFLADTLQALCGNAHHRKSFRTSSKNHRDDEDDTNHLFTHLLSLSPPVFTPDLNTRLLPYPILDGYTI